MSGRGPAWPSRRPSRPRPGRSRSGRGRSSEQSASLPGRTAPSSPDFLRTRSRALRAASRARAALAAFSMMARPTGGCSSRKLPRCSLTTDLTMPSTSELPSLVLVCPSNCGSRTLMCSTQVSPSRTSSPESVKPSFFIALIFLANSLIVRVSADLRPVRWVPPSWVLMLLTKVKVFSLYPSSYCRARSTSTSSLVTVKATGLGWSAFLLRFSHSTNWTRPPLA